MASNETGECCVCGKETANRCGACAEADFSLFFCSREHQKLIWPVHKRVCGPGRCNPFRWPLFTTEEVDNLLQGLHRRHDLGGADGTLSEVLELQFGFPDTLLSFAAGHAKTLPPVQHEAVLGTLHSMYGTLFAADATALFGTSNQLTRTAAAVLAPFPGIMSDMTDSSAPSPPWWSRYQHLTLVFVVLCQAAEQRGGVFDAFAKQAQGVLSHLLRQEAAQTHPDEVKDFFRDVERARSALA